MWRLLWSKYTHARLHMPRLDLVVGFCDAASESLWYNALFSLFSLSLFSLFSLQFGKSLFDSVCWVLLFYIPVSLVVLVTSCYQICIVGHCFGRTFSGVYLWFDILAWVEGGRRGKRNTEWRGSAFAFAFAVYCSVFVHRSSRGFVRRSRNTMGESIVVYVRVCVSWKFWALLFLCPFI